MNAPAATRADYDAIACESWSSHQPRLTSTPTRSTGANDPHAGCEEMDERIVALTLNGSSTKSMAVRNASDPQRPDCSPASRKLANDLYERYGYRTSVASCSRCGASSSGCDCAEGS